MSDNNQNRSIGLEPGPRLPQTKSPGEKLEGIAFTFCKVATVALIAGRFTLPVAAGLAAAFYVLAYTRGQRDTRCILYYPLVIAGFWSLIAGISSYAILMPAAWHRVLSTFIPWMR